MSLDLNIQDAMSLLDRMISTPSFSREESDVADLLTEYLSHIGMKNVNRFHNNVYVRSSHYDADLPTLMLNSHIDTVRPSAAYTRNPFLPTHEEGRIYGLGSNDAGGSVVALIAASRLFWDVRLPFNLLLALTAEEEITGEHGMRGLLPELGTIDMAIVGEPTNMQAAVGERGLVVLDCVAHGVQGHAARNEGVNAVLKAVDDINCLRNYKFGRRSELLGDIKMTVTQIDAGYQHNIVPDVCRFVVDVRTTDAYSNREVVELLRSVLSSEVVPRSTRIEASAIDMNHPLVMTARSLGLNCFISPTTSDMAVMKEIPSLKMGVGDSSRSHSADEYVLESEIIDGVNIYTDFIARLAKLF